MTFLSPAPKPDSKGYTRGARKVCCRFDQETGGRTEREGGSGETRGTTEESTVGMFSLFSEEAYTIERTIRSCILLILPNLYE